MYIYLSVWINCHLKSKYNAKILNDNLSAAKMLCLSVPAWKLTFRLYIFDMFSYNCWKLISSEDHNNGQKADDGHFGIIRIPWPLYHAKWEMALQINLTGGTIQQLWSDQLNQTHILRLVVRRICMENRIIGSYTSPYWRSGISSTSVRNSVFSRVERSGTSGKTLNLSHELKKFQTFNNDECKYLFLPFHLQNEACRFYSFIRMSMSCLLHKILQRHVQCSKYTLI